MTFKKLYTLVILSILIGAQIQASAQQETIVYSFQDPSVPGEIKYTTYLFKNKKLLGVRLFTSKKEARFFIDEQSSKPSHVMRQQSHEGYVRGLATSTSAMESNWRNSSARVSRNYQKDFHKKSHEGYVRRLATSTSAMESNCENNSARDSESYFDWNSHIKWIKGKGLDEETKELNKRNDEETKKLNKRKVDMAEYAFNNGITVIQQQELFIEGLVALQG